MSTKTQLEVEDLLENIRPCKKIVANELKGKDFKSVLEVGCQWGESLKAIQNEFDGKILTGVDLNPDELEKVEGLLPGINLIWANGGELPFEDDSFDVVYTSALFCMVSPQRVETILNEIIRVTKKYIYLVELDIEPLIDLVETDRVACNWKALFKVRGFDIVKRKITKEEWDCMPWKHYGYLISTEK